MQMLDKTLLVEKCSPKARAAALATAVLAALLLGACATPSESGPIESGPAAGNPAAATTGIRHSVHPGPVAAVRVAFDRNGVTASRVHGVADLATGREVTVGPAIAITPPLAQTDNSTTVFFTGGVGACFYDQTPYAARADIAAYGDVGPLLAAAMRDNPRIARLDVRRPPETIRATVLGAAAQTVTLSGSTIWADRDLLPLRNIPVVHPQRDTSTPLSQSIVAALARWDLESDAVAAIVIDMPTGIGYDHVTAVARNLVAHHARGGGRYLPLVLVMAQDYAQVLGQTIHSLAPGIPLLVIDQVGLGEGDYIDIGLPMLDGRAVPLSIKTLVFYD